MLGALAMIPILMAVAIRLFGGSNPGRGPAFLDQIAANGLFVGMAAMAVAIPLFLPLTVSVAAGDAIAGEASHGTLRYLLIAPAGRVRLLIVKYLAAAAFCVAATLTVVVVGTLAGWALFPIGPVTLLSGGQVSVAEGLLRLLAIAAYVVGVAPRSLGHRTLPLDAHRRADRRDGGHGDPRGRVADRRRDPAARCRCIPGCSPTGGSTSPTSCAPRRCGTPSPRTPCCRAPTSSCSARPRSPDSAGRTCCPRRSAPRASRPPAVSRAIAAMNASMSASVVSNVHIQRTSFFAASQS